MYINNLNVNLIQNFKCFKIIKNQKKELFYYFKF